MTATLPCMRRARYWRFPSSSIRIFPVFRIAADGPLVRQGTLASATPKRGWHDQAMANVVFSLCAALACLIVAVLAAAKDAPVVALVWGALAIGFVGRAAYGYARMRKG